MLECNLNTVLDSMVAKDSRLPISVKCELTYRCNFSCHHCYCRFPANSRMAKKELSFSEWDRILGECADEGALFLTFTGGEPLLRPDFKDIWRMAKRRGFLISLFTNGSLIDEELIDFFKEWSPTDISITLYGVSEEVFGDVTATLGMFPRVLNTIRQLRDANIPVSTKSIITRRNVSEFDALRDLNKQFSEYFKWDGTLFGSSSQGGGKPLQERISVETLRTLEHRHSERKDELIKLFNKNQVPMVIPEKSYKCALGRAGFGIDPYGNLRPCTLLEPLQFDLRQLSIRNAWRDSVPRELEKFQWGESKCKGCELAILCCICPAMALREGARPEGPTDYHCAVGRMRFEMMDM